MSSRLDWTSELDSVSENRNQSKPGPTNHTEMAMKNLCCRPFTPVLLFWWNVCNIYPFKSIYSHCNVQPLPSFLPDSFNIASLKFYTHWTVNSSLSYQPLETTLALFISRNVTPLIVDVQHSCVYVTDVGFLLWTPKCSSRCSICYSTFLVKTVTALVMLILFLGLVVWSLCYRE